eukprot:6307171-Heterocapsa_arctica.AAC.1
MDMANMEILEGPKKERSAEKEVQPPEASVEHMQRVVMHQDVPQQRSCVMKQEGKHIEKDVIGEG